MIVLWKGLAALGELEGLVENPGAGALWRGKAKSVIDKIIPTIDDPALVTSFTTRPEVARALEAR